MAGMKIKGLRTHMAGPPLPATERKLEVEFTCLIPKHTVMRFDADKAEAITTVYIKRVDWEALGSPAAVRLTVEPL